jgi:hypothetical protein
MRHAGAGDAYVPLALTIAARVPAIETLDQFFAATLGEATNGFRLVDQALFE